MEIDNVGHLQSCNYGESTLDCHGYGLNLIKDSEMRVTWVVPGAMTVVQIILLKKGALGRTK
jgi:hypothetical protein